jgi:hypothetical protein
MSPEDGELMPEHHDFKVLEIRRPNEQHGELKHAAKDTVAERQEHEASKSRESSPILPIGLTTDASTFGPTRTTPRPGST